VNDSREKKIQTITIIAGREEGIISLISNFLQLVLWIGIKTFSREVATSLKKKKLNLGGH